MKKKPSKLYLEMKKAGVLQCLPNWYCKSCRDMYKKKKVIDAQLAEEMDKFFLGFAYRKKK